MDIFEKHKRIQIDRLTLNVLSYLLRDTKPSDYKSDLIERLDLLDRQLERDEKEAFAPIMAIAANGDRCPSCGVDFNEFPEMRHTEDECGGPECTCYEVTGGHQMGCAFYGAKQ